MLQIAQMLCFGRPRGIFPNYQKFFPNFCLENQGKSDACILYVNVLVIEQVHKKYKMVFDSPPQRARCDKVIFLLSRFNPVGSTPNKHVQ